MKESLKKLIQDMRDREARADSVAADASAAACAFRLAKDKVFKAELEAADAKLAAERAGWLR